jgi:hypothetical protein
MQAKNSCFADGLFCADFRPLRAGYPQPQGATIMIEKQFGTESTALPCNAATKPPVSSACKPRSTRPGGFPYGWIRIYEVLLFAFYNPRTGPCFPSHKAVAAKARCGVRTVQRALKWARDNGLIQWAHGLVRDGYAFAAFLTMRRILVSIASSNGQRRRGIPTSYKSLADIAAEARSFSFPTAPSLASCI